MVEEASVIQKDITSYEHLSYLDEYINVENLVQDLDNGDVFPKNEIAKLTNVASSVNKFSAFMNIYVSQIKHEEVNFKKFNSILFDQISYRKLKNVYFDRIDKSELDKNLGNVTNFIYERFHKEHRGIDETLAKRLKNQKNGYNSLLTFSCTEPNTIFFPVVQKVNDTIKFLMVVTSVGKEKIEYCIASSIIDLRKNTMIFLIRNNLNTSSSIDGICLDTKINIDSIYNWFKEEIVKKKLNIKIKQHNEEAECNAMYTMHKELINKVLETPRSIVREDTNNLKIIEKSVTLISKHIRNLNLNGAMRKDISLRIFNIFLSKYIEQEMSATKLRNTALKNNAFGFPTGLDFYGGSNAESSSKVKATKETPLVSEELFYDIYQSLDNSKELPHWRISWFKQFLYKDNTIPGGQLIQTTIYVKNGYFKIVFLPKNIDKKIVTTVLNKVVEYLK